jgi:hypothetical protein
VKTTNYLDTFIEVADDHPAEAAELPPTKGSEQTVAQLQYDMIADHPYAFSRHDVPRVLAYSLGRGS